MAQVQPQPPLKLLLTGEPGCGKTTVIRRVVERLRGRVSMSGFLTEEFRSDGRRQGFRGVTLEGTTFDLADRRFGGELRVGCYGVDLRSLETTGIAALRSGPRVELVVVDEIGKMELLSAAFRQRIDELLREDVALLGTIALHGVGFVKRVRQDPRVTTLHLRREARETMVDEIVRRLGSSLERPRRGVRPRPDP